MKQLILLITIFFLSLSSHATGRKTKSCNTPVEGMQNFFEYQGNFGPSLYDLSLPEAIKFFEGMDQRCLELFLQHPASDQYKTTFLETHVTHFGKGKSEEIKYLAKLSNMLVGAHEAADIVSGAIESLNEEKQKCSYKDRRAELPPVRNQDSTGWCYAYTAADMLSHKTGESVSATDLAINYHTGERARDVASEIFNGPIQNIFDRIGELDNASLREGGFVGDALAMTKLAGGYCPESVVASTDQSNEGAMTDILTYLNELSDWRKNQTDVYFGIQPKLSGELCKFFGQQVRSIFPLATMNDVEGIFRNPATTDFFARFVRQQCSKHRKPFEYSLKMAGDGGEQFGGPISREKRSSGDNTDLINEALDADSIAGIYYDARFLQEGAYAKGANTSRSEEGKKKPGDDEEEFNAVASRHASTIVGRRWNEDSNSCEYLIRNSWGTDCGRYNPNLDCEGGNLWVPKQTLLEKTDTVLRLQ